VDNLVTAAQEGKRDLATAEVLIQRNSAAISQLQRRIQYLGRRVLLPPLKTIV